MKFTDFSVQIYIYFKDHDALIIIIIVTAYLGFLNITFMYS